MDDIKEWLQIAKSNLIVGRGYEKFAEEGPRYEEFCFDLQQSVEKSLKALLLYKEIPFPKTHSIATLITLLKEQSIDLPEFILDSAQLTKYAVNTRYPDDYIEVTKEDYLKAVEIAENIYNWVEGQINNVK